MPKYAMRPLAYLAGRWRAWLPPVIFAIIVFVGAVALSGGKEFFFLRLSRLLTVRKWNASQPLICCVASPRLPWLFRISLC